MMGKRSLVSVVDDDESVRESLPDLLREFGFAAEAFSSAEAFLASDVVSDTSCLLLDIAMPGMSVRSASCCCSSSPLSPGSVTSSTKQHGTVGRRRDRNSCADANVSGCQPAVLINSSNDSRTETSSSTTKTMDVTSGVVMPRSDGLRTAN